MIKKVINPEEKFLNAVMEALQQYYENEVDKDTENLNASLDFIPCGNSAVVKTKDNIFEAIILSYEDYYRNEKLRGIPLYIEIEEETDNQNNK